MNTINEKRATYRHGDLYRALLDVAIELARSGGRDAVVLREVTRRVGVAPNAAYRHFADRTALLQAVSWASQAAVARAIEHEFASISAEPASPASALAHLRAVGTGYLTFAISEPGLFRMAFSIPDNLNNADNPDCAGDSGLTPYRLLGLALDKMVSAGVLPAARRPNAEFLAWSSVHGLAMLVLEGPLRGLDRNQIGAVGQQLIDMVERGL